MLDLAEKIIAGVCGLLLLITLYFYYAIGGMPSTYPVEFVPSIGDAAAEAAPAEGPPAVAEAPRSITPQDQAIIDKLKEQGSPGLLPGQAVPTKRQPQVPTQLFEYISAEANWFPELKRLKHTPITTKNGPTRIKIFDIQPNSLMKKCGFQENDIIELVDGEILQFHQSATTEYRRLFQSKIEKLRGGEPLSITITRNNRPLNLIFKL